MTIMFALQNKWLKFHKPWNNCRVCTFLYPLPASRLHSMAHLEVRRWPTSCILGGKSNSQLRCMQVGPVTMPGSQEPNRVCTLSVTDILWQVNIRNEGVQYSKFLKIVKYMYAFIDIDKSKFIKCHFNYHGSWHKLTVWWLILNDIRIYTNDNWPIFGSALDR